MTERKIAYYRLLNVGEIIPEGAEFSYNGRYGWQKSICIGETFDPEDEGLYRVPMYEDEFAPKESRVIVSLDDETKRFLVDFESRLLARIEDVSETIRFVGRGR